MQIYDRVVPTGASATLWVLSLGVLGAIAFEWAAKNIRSRLNESIIEAVDQRLGRDVFMRLLQDSHGQIAHQCGELGGASQSLRKRARFSNRLCNADAN